MIARITADPFTGEVRETPGVGEDDAAAPFPFAPACVGRADYDDDDEFEDDDAEDDDDFLDDDEEDDLFEDDEEEDDDPFLNDFGDEDDEI